MSVLPMPDTFPESINSASRTLLPVLYLTKWTGTYSLSTYLDHNYNAASYKIKVDTYDYKTLGAMQSVLMEVLTFFNALFLTENYV